MAVTPLIKPIQTKKGIFYTFQSALEDLNTTFNNNGANKFRFSKFVLLRIPEIGDPNTQKLLDNKIQFDAIGSTPIVEGLSTNQNINLANSFQNYALNLEALIVSQATYNRETKLNVSERVFWKWLKELGAVRWRTANSTSQFGQPEVSANVPAGEKRFAEDFYDASESPYNRVAVYVGDIDVVNSVQNRENSYSELYIHVPTNVGLTPTVLFKSVTDQNYGPNMLIVHDPDDPLNEERLSGRDWQFMPTHPVPGMSLTAFYDLDDNNVTTYLSPGVEFNGILPSDPTTSVLGYAPSSQGFWWGAINNNNSYFTEPSTNYSVAKTNRIKKVYQNRQVEYLRSTLDGVTVDFNLSNYQLAYQNPQIKTFAHLNDYTSALPFEFNAILVYYEVFDDSGATTVSETNLYGVYFLNKVEQSGLEFAIPYITKDVPDPIQKTNGNSFAFKINVKFDTSIEEVSVEKSINDFNTFSLDLFTDVLTEFKRLQTSYNEKLLELENLRQSVENAKDVLSNTNVLQKLDTRLLAVENSLAASQTALANSSDIMDMIESTSDKVDDLLAGRTSINVSYNLNAIRPGAGIIVDKTIPNEVTIASDVTPFRTIEDFNIGTAVQNTITLKLGLYNNYYRHSANGASTTLSNDILIKIDDTSVDWRKGQVVQIVFHDQVIPAGQTIRIRTDAKNKLGEPTAYSNASEIVALTDTDFPTTYGRNGKLILTIICKDERTFDFNVDKITR